MRVRFRRGSLRDGCHDQGWQQARKLPNAHTLARQQRGMATRPGDLSPVGFCDGCYPTGAASSNWRASLVPAAAVIPAAAVYTNIAAVKKLVVDGGWPGRRGSPPLLWRGCDRVFRLAVAESRKRTPCGGIPLIGAVLKLPSHITPVCTNDRPKGRSAAETLVSTPPSSVSGERPWPLP